MDKLNATLTNVRAVALNAPNIFCIEVRACGTWIPHSWPHTTRDAVLTARWLERFYRFHGCYEV